MFNPALRYSLLILACLSQTAFAQDTPATGVPLPIQASETESAVEPFFAGASLAVYDPLDSAVSADKAAKPRPTVSLETRENNLVATIARGEISEPPAKPLTDKLVSNLGWSLGAVLLSSSLDRDGDRLARQRGQNSTIKALTTAGNALPFIALGAAGLATLDSSDPRLNRTGLAALQAGGIGVVTGLGLKYAFARARPEADLGPSQFHASSTKRGDSSMPSIHSATTWGVITPFAKEYGMPWLYGVAALTNFARVADRKHWVSDTVAGSALGYWLGDIAWHHNRLDDRSSTQVYLGERSIAFNWSFQ